MATIYHPVAAPAVAPRRFGLFSVAEIRTSQIEGTTLDEHWRLGITWQSQACSPVKATQAPCVDATGPISSGLAKDHDEYCYTPEFDPFTLYAYNNDAVPGRTLDEHRADAIARLTNGEELGAERELWSRLTTAAGVPADATSLPGYAGLGYAESLWASQFGGVGVLHMDHMTASALESVLVREGGRMFTLAGTPVIIGGGYHAGAPAIDTLGTIIVTGPVVVYRGDIDTRESAVDKAVNRVSIIAERDYVIGWDCDALAVNISLCDTCIPPTS